MGRPETQHTILIETLTLAVPLWIDRLAMHDPARRDNLIQSWAADAADAVSSRGDVLQYGGKRGEAASVFNAMARGLAALAHSPGGVTFLGVGWCARHSPGGRDSAAWEALCPACVADPGFRQDGRILPTRRAVRQVETATPREEIM